MIQNISYKDFFKRYGIFVAFLAIIFGIVIYTVKLSQNSWNKNLRTSVIKVLNEKKPDNWTIEGNVEIKNPFTLNAACYDVKSAENGELYKAFIIRTQTLYGPLPAVFLLDNNNKVEFVGYSSLHGVVETQLMANKNSKRIEYWIHKIPDIVEQGSKEVEND